MLPSHSIQLRSAFVSWKVPPVLITPCCAASKPIQQRFFKSSTRPSTTTPSPFHHTKNPHQNTTIRFESTTATPLSSTPFPLISNSDLQPLTWNAYLSLRKTRRRYNLVSSLFSSLLTTAGGISALTTLNMEQINIFGLDPFLVLGLATLGSGAVGWLLGPFLGNAVFGMAHRRVGPQIAEVSHGHTAGMWLGLRDGC